MDLSLAVQRVCREIKDQEKTARNMMRMMAAEKDYAMALYWKCRSETIAMLVIKLDDLISEMEREKR